MNTNELPVEIRPEKKIRPVNLLYYIRIRMNCDRQNRHRSAVYGLPAKLFRIRIRIRSPMVATPKRIGALSDIANTTCGSTFSSLNLSKRALSPNCSRMASIIDSFLRLSRKNKPNWRHQAARSLDPTRVLCIVGRS